jgi:hypothetical protein
MPQEMKFNSDMGIMDAAMFIGYDWVTAVTYEAGHGCNPVVANEHRSVHYFPMFRVKFHLLGHY